MDHGRLFHNPRCSKSRGALELLRERGIEPAIVPYLEQPPSPAELRALLQLLGIDARGLLRTGESEYNDLGLNDPTLSDKALIAAMSAHPRLIERPIFVHNGRAVIGRPPERVLELLD
ncbi:arsenate reductase (glutaredoxin) [Lysobacter sp. CFH 32150]|uniref:arsenate reductase (glutaredoxin) n=1 Tax=Lysobacter sp. CFH 32150 TaxID=2927128 RepID=UPI001FA7A1E4|nr:arsenate reductase (glutaredoxin) [Lysobacter sp. CFH 32150]MCI4566474.1 arsenate reductase (glutaredoxin) [Lysobacter sp. CFH 32150]